jgi:tripartite-type tricarboxylate transporter receptor subunit TctC
MNLRQSLRALSLCLMAMSACAQTDSYPTRPITLVVPFPPGGPTDASARLIGKEMSASLGQPVVIDNRAGAGGTVGSAAVAKSPADGYTLLWGGTSSLVVAPALYPGLSYDPVKSFAPIGMVVRGPMMIAGKANLPAKNMVELLTLAKSQKLSFGSAGAGSIGHLAGELFQETNSTDVLHVPYRGGAPALNDLLGGQIDLIFETAQFMTPHIKAGKAIPFGVAGSKRYPGLPDVPTLNELLGKNAFEAYSWFGLVAPANTPRPILMALEKSLQKTMSDPAILAQVTASGFETVNSQSDFLAQAIASDLKKWRELVQRRNIKPD